MANCTSLVASLTTQKVWKPIAQVLAICVTQMSMSLHDTSLRFTHSDRGTFAHAAKVLVGMSDQAWL